MQNQVLVSSNKPDHHPLFDRATSSVGLQAVAGNSLSLSFTQPEKHQCQAMPTNVDSALLYVDNNNCN